MMPSRLRPDDVARAGASGLRTRPTRVMLSALGITLGVAAMLAVVGISTSSRAQVNRELDRLGTNLLSVSAGSSLTGEPAELPPESITMISRIGPVQAVSATARLLVGVYRNDHVDSGATSGVAVLAARADLLAAVGGRVRIGRGIGDLTGSAPVVVLGSIAARRLNITDAGVRVWLGGQWFGVAGILDQVTLAPELDSAALLSFPAAQQWLGFGGHPTTIYVRIDEPSVESVRAILPATADPQHPEQVQVSRPSDALVARRDTDRTLTALLLGLGAVALLVGGVGVANTMIISVLERRSEIGLRRALGATRRHIRLQFLVESLLLSGLGGVGGCLLGLVVTGAYARSNGWPTVLPVWASTAGVGLTLAIGALAGVYPAVRASRLSPTEALATP